MNSVHCLYFNITHYSLFTINYSLVLKCRTYSTKQKKIELVIFDVDGVMTDGSLFMGDDGQEYKAFNSKDGHGLRMLLECGLQAAIITGRRSSLVEHRMRDLGIEIVFQGYRDKRPAFAELIEQTGLQPQQVAYMGDDVVDLPIMTQVGMAIAVNDAHPFVLQHADYITEKAGGCGAAREAPATSFRPLPVTRQTTDSSRSIRPALISFVTARLTATLSIIVRSATSTADSPGNRPRIAMTRHSGIDTLKRLS